MIVKAKSGGVVAGARIGRGRRKLLSGACGAALALACAFPSAARADTYLVNSEAELTAALVAAAGNADPSTTIILGSSFSVSTTTFTLPNKPVTIDTQGFVLTGPNSGQGTLIAGPSGTNTLTLAGNFGGNAGVTAGTLSLTGTGSTTSTATIRGSSVTNAGQTPGIGLSLNGTGTFVNEGTIAAGDSISYTTITTGNNAGAAVSINSGGTLINNNLIQGSNGQSGSDGFAVYSSNLGNTSFIVNNGTIRGGSNSDPAFAGGAAIRGVGSSLLTITNAGTLEGGNGAAAIQSFDQAWSVKIINKGTIRAGAGSTDAIRMDTNGGTRLYLELWATSNIEGNVTASVSGTETLGFGGPDDASFDISQVSPTGKYRNFDTSDKFEKNGTSTWTLTGTNAMLMDWTINQGTLQVGDGGAASVAFRQVVDNGTLVFNSSAANTVSGLITGTGSIVQSGSGTTTLVANTNTYNGGTTITGGKLSVASNGALGNVAGALTIDGGTLQWTGASGSLARPINWGASGGGFEVTTASSALTIGQLAGGGALVKSGAGALTLAGDNSYTGGTTIAAGTLNIGNGGTTGSVTGDIVDNSTLAFNRTNAYTYAGAITGTGGVSKANTGTVTLTGQNHYGGATSISSGQLLIAGGGTTISGGTTSINATAAVPVTLGVDGAGSTFSTASISGTTVTTNRTITVSVTNGGHLTTSSGDISLRASTLTAASTNTAELFVDGAGSRADVAGGLVLANSSTTNGKLTISGGGALHTAGASTIGFATGNTRGVPSATITGAGSNWTSTGSLAMSNGDFTLDQGGTASFVSATFGTGTLPATLVVTGAGSSLATTTGDLVLGSGTGTGELTLSDGGSVNIAGSLVLADSGTATGILNIGGAEGQAAAGAGAFTAPTLNLGSATSRINFNHNDPLYSFDTLIGGSGALNQVAGTTILSADNSYSGATTVSGGILRVNGNQSAATGLTSVLNGGTLGGSGTIGGNVFVDNGGTLAPGNSPGTLTINGDLTLSNASLLDYEFGHSNVVGGPLNDLTVVGGNLTLDGTIDATVTAGGSFDVGLYRVISYGGTLNDQGLALGSMPGGSAVDVQTSVAAQVNLVNSGGATVNFWDGDAGPKFNGLVNGGNGVWQNSTGNDNWADITGNLNAGYADDSFAIFAAAPGTVTVDNGPGQVSASGMQFASDGYVVSGGDLALTGSDSVIRVGDGTTIGAGFTATIASNLTVAGNFAKTDLGTLVLTGTSQFSNAIYVTNGTLKVANGGVVNSTGTDPLLVNIDANLVVTGPGSRFTTTLDLIAGRGTDTASITVDNGGQLTARRSFLGEGSDLANGSKASAINITVNGPGSVFNAGDAFQLAAAAGGTAALTISNGGVLQTTPGAEGSIGRGGDGTALVTGAGSQLLADNLLYIGVSFNGGAGHGQLTIQDGGLVTSSMVAMGYNDTVTSGSTGTLSLLGMAGSRGVLETGLLSRGYGDASIIFDGGVLRATADNAGFIENLGADELLLTLGANGGFIDSNGHDVGVAPIFVGTGGLTKDGAGTLTLTGANTYTGGTTIGAGTLQIGDGGTAGSILGNVVDNGELAFNRSDIVSFGGLVSGSGSVTQRGAGVTVLTGANSYAGATNVTAGTLLIDGNQSGATGQTIVAAGATLGGNGTIGGDVVVTGGTLTAGNNGVGTLTINGSLSLDSASQLGFDFGQANNPGGPRNDLLNIGGNLTLDGTINVTTSPGGAFDIGAYRVANYGGTLTDNGLSLGALPAGATVFVQTSVAGQVNLVNTGGLDLNFWDGAAGPKFDNAVNGGNGVWQASTGNDNWTVANGAVNAGYSNGAFAIFSGTAGTVTIDGSLGAVTASGLQFASDGYAITGDALTLNGTQSVIRVGDGSAAGQGYTATIASQLTGTSQLVKTDLGTLILSSDNLYTGGTLINAGVLQIDRDGALGVGGPLTIDGGTLRTTADLVSNRLVTLGSGGGTIDVASATAVLGNVVDGAGQLIKRGGGTLTLTGANTYTGGTVVDAGTFRIGNGGTTGSILGNVVTNGTLEFSRSDAYAFGGVISGTGSLSQIGGGTVTLTADNNYSGGTVISNGTLQLGNGGTTGSITGNVRNDAILAFDRSNGLTFSGLISGTGSVMQAGTGTTVLTGNNSYAGTTDIDAGILLINGNQSAATGLTRVATGASLGGTGTIGGNVTVADGGTLAPGSNGVGALTINGNLALAGGALLAYDFGQANTPGGPLNDLVNVGGNLTLDGTLDVTVPAGGAFGGGIYRLFNYGGTLTDNGLTLGALPAGSDVFVQTSISGQVNLVNTVGATLSFWDGAPGPKNDGVINGGIGTWQNGTGNDNWTNANGTLNAPYSDGTFAVFGGTGGTVTVDNSLGNISAAGMQFASNGYVISGGAIALTGPQSTLRVGDGSTAGAGYTATISSVLSGNAQLVKTDAGTLVLGGANTYTGGTLINGGTLQISGDANLGAAAGNVTLDGGTLATSASFTSARGFVAASTGTISTANGTTLTLAGVLSGAGALAKSGAGTLLLTGDSGGYAGATTVSGGTLSVRGVLGGTVTVGAAARLEGIGQVGSVTNGGIVAPGGDALGTLTIAGSYSGNGGMLEIASTLGGDASPADLLVVSGGTSGSTEVVLTNRGGLGAQTAEGIKIVDVAGASNGVFTLHGDYQFDGSPAVIAGAYGYRLYKGGVTTPADGDWYLRSSLLDGGTPNTPNVPLYQPGVPVYEAYGQTLLALNDLGTMQERIGNRQWAPASAGKSFGIWGRMESRRTRPNATLSTSLADVNIDSWKWELGADHVLSERSDGATLVLGIVGGYGEAKADIGSPFGNGRIKTSGYSAGATLSWFGPQGFYVDSRAQVTWYDSKLKSSILGTLADGNKGTGEAYSVEVGKRAPIGEGLSVTPQMQMVYSTVSFDRFTDPNGALVSSDAGDSLKTRWGISLDQQDARSHLYAVASLSYEWLDGTVTDITGTPAARANHRLWGDFGVGGSVTLGNRVVLYSEASANTALGDFGKSYSLKGVAGLRLAF